MDQERNLKIFTDWIHGTNYKELASIYNLSEESIKNICIKQIPQRLRVHHWQRMNQYQKTREFLRKQSTYNNQPKLHSKSVKATGV